MYELAPIGLSVYTRISHLQRTVKALQANILADKSELYIYSDAAKPGDEEKVSTLRSYLQTIKGFKKIIIIERKTNDRVKNSRGGIRTLVERYRKVIFLAEDIITAPGFLLFMNQALDKYKSNKQVFNISGYSPPLNIPDTYQHDCFLLRRFCGWGFGIWADRFAKLRYISPQEYETFLADKKGVKSFVSAGGDDMLIMLKRDAYGEIDAGDVKLMYAQFLSDQYTVYPVGSLVFNAGHDGSGVHCDKNNRFDVELSDKTVFHLPSAPSVDGRIVRANLKFRNSHGKTVCM